MTGAAKARRLALLFGALGMTLVAAAPAIGQVNIVPTEEVLEDPIKKAKKLVRDTVEKTEEVVDEAQETADYIVDDTEETVDETVDHVRDEVDEVVEGVVAKPKSPEARKPGPRPTRPRRERAPEPADVLSTRRTRDSRTYVGATEAALTFARARPASARDETNLAVEPSSPLTPGDVARNLAFPLLMMAAVVAYLLLQGRIDRRDPKLRFHVELEGERLSFE